MEHTRHRRQLTRPSRLTTHGISIDRRVSCHIWKSKNTSYGGICVPVKVVLLYQINWYFIPIKYHLQKYQKTGIQNTRFLVLFIPVFWYILYQLFGTFCIMFWYKSSTIILVHWYFLYQESGMTIPQKAKTWYCQYHYYGSKNTTKAGIGTLYAHTRIQNRVGRESYY